ncbi:MAG TPA: insulinase family protein [Kofleriaceae bacterium]|jgi:zinc protease
MTKISLAAVAMAMLAAACGPDTPKFAFREAEQRGKLDANGLRFVIMPDPTTQLVEVDVRYDVGSREDPPGKAGLAHLVEHMMFQQRPDGPTSPPLMESLGQLTTYFNAYTNWDTTHYQTAARAENLDALLKIEAMRMYFGCETVQQTQFEREREVVRNEIRMRDGSPEGQIEQLLLSAIYPKGHAYERNVGGNDEQIATAQLGDACKFMKDYYAPERATVIIAGGVDVEATTKAIEKWFGKIPKRAAAPRRPVAVVTGSQTRQEFEVDVERPQVNIAWAMPASNTKEGEAVRFGVNSAFFDVAQHADDYNFAYSVQPAFFGGQLAPAFIISIELKNMDKLDEALDFVQKAVKNAARDYDQGSYEQVKELKDRRKAAYISELEPLSARTNNMGDLVQFTTDFDFNSTDKYVFHELDKIEKFDPKDIGGAVKKYLAWDKAHIVVIKPNANGIKSDKRSTVKFQAKSDEQITQTNVDPAEAKRPIRMGAELKTLAGATHFTLGNGMRVTLLPVKSMPLATAALIFRNAGEASQPDSDVPAATAELMHLPQNAEVFRQAGINIRCRTTPDTFECGTHGINIYLDVMVKGLERQIKVGSTEPDSVDSFEKQQKGALKTRQEEEQQEFARQFYGALYGPDHPYTRAQVDNVDKVGKVHLDAIQSFQHDHLTAQNASLVLVGDFDPKYAESLVRSTFGDWDKGGLDKPVAAVPFKRTGPAFIGVVGKEGLQLSVEVGYPAPAGVDGQEAARQVVAEMLNTRTEDVRFKLGSTYGVYMYRRPNVGPTAYMMAGGFGLGGKIDAERVGESVRAIRDGFDMLRKGNPKYDEKQFDIDFVKARRKIIQNLLGQSTVTRELAGELSFLERFGLNGNYYNTLLQSVAAVSPAQVHALFDTELAPANETIVILGDRPHLEKAFKDAGIDDVKYVEPQYVK